MRQFDFYEFVGFLAPGMLLLAGLSYLIPDQAKLFSVHDVSIGGFGIGVIIAYAVGQLLQSIGNAVEKIWWKLWSGMPTDWVRTGKRFLISENQVRNLEAGVQGILGSESFRLGSGLNAGAWYSVTRQIFAAVASAGRQTRIDVFNGNYGLCRGLAAALLVLALVAAMQDWMFWQRYAALLLLGLLGLYRMHRFGVHYARETFVQFLQLPETKSRPSKG